MDGPGTVVDSRRLPPWAGGCFSIPVYETAGRILGDMTEYTRHPDLPDDFIWAPRTQHETLPTALMLHGEVLVSMLDRVGGGWVARLHLDDGVSAPLLMRRCTDFSAGRKGAELWVMRHEAQLRAKVARKQKWVQENVALHPASKERVAPSAGSHQPSSR